MQIIKNTICRLCLKQHEKLVHIFDENDNEEKNEISRYINIFFAVEITKADQYSTYVCKPCWDSIVILCKNRLLFRSNNAYLWNNAVVIPNTENDTHNHNNCHNSIKNILAKYEGIKLNLNSSWHKNFDAVVDLSDCRVPDELLNNNVFLIKGTNKSSRKRKKLKYVYETDGSDSEESIALHRSKRNYKRTKIFGNPFSLTDENADDSDSDPVFSVLKTYNTCELINPSNIQLTSPKINALKSRKSTNNIEKTTYPISQCKFQAITNQQTNYKTVQCTEDIWNEFANIRFQMVPIL